VNDETYGLYVQVEAATKDYLKRWFEDPSGDLFEGPGGVIDWEDLDLDSNQESGDRTRIRMLYEAIMEADPIDPWSTLKNWIDLKAFARFMANEQFINNWDGYPEANNYRLYDDPTTGKFYFFPHGADQSMEDSRHDMFGTNLEEVVGRALVMTQTGRQAYREAIQGFLDHAWDSEKTLERIRSWYVRIYPHITSGLAPFDENLFEHNVTQIIKFVKMRPFVVRHQLNVDALRADWKHYDEVLPFFEPYSEQ
jgi:cytochrome c2